MLDGGDAAQVHHETVKGLEAPSLALGEFDGLPEGVAAAQAILLMAVQDDELGSPAHRQGPENPLETSCQSDLPPGRATSGAALLLPFHGHVIVDLSPSKLGTQMPVVDQAQGMVQKTGHRHGRPPLVQDLQYPTRDTALAATFLCGNGRYQHRPTQAFPG